MPSKGVFLSWVLDDKKLHDQYTRARDTQADGFAEEVADIADNEPDPNRARVRIDARKWIAGKQKPKKYGDKLDIEHEGEVTITVKYDK